MGHYIYKRLMQSLVALFILSLIVFLLARASGNPVELLLPSDATVQDRVEMIQRLGLDKPLTTQYYVFITRTLSGQFEDSIKYGRSSLSLFWQRFPNSAQLILVSMVLGWGISIPLGVIAGSNRGRFVDKAIRMIAVFGIAAPSFWIALALIYIFAVNLEIFPAARMEGPLSYVLPVFALSFAHLAGLTRLIRSSLIEVLDSEFAKLARIKGVSQNVVLFRHCLRNALIPALSLAGIQFAHLMGGTVVIETVFAWPGSGRLLYEAITNRDYPVMQTIILLIGMFIVFVNLTVDILYSYVDPRIRYS